MYVLADIISTVEFNDTGELLATGDKGGRIVIFHRSPVSLPTSYNYSSRTYYIVDTIKVLDPSVVTIKHFAFIEGI